VNEREAGRGEDPMHMAHGTRELTTAHAADKAQDTEDGSRDEKDQADYDQGHGKS